MKNETESLDKLGEAQACLPLDCIGLRNGYSFTINMSPKKILTPKRFNRVLRRCTIWSDLSNDEQKKYFDDLLYPFSPLGKDMTYYYELTKNGLVHVHGYFISDIDFALDFQKNIVTLCGFPSLDASICCKIEKTLYTTEAWVKYMRKQQEIGEDGKPYSFDLNKSLF